MNRLKQIGIALHAHQAATGQFTVPQPGRYISGSMVFGSDTGLSGYYELLPHLELAQIYNAINVGGIGTPRPLGVPVLGVENATVYRLQISQFLCPSDNFRATGRSGPVSYRFNVGSSHPYNLPPQMRTGAFEIISPAGPQAFTDGLANTVGFSERIIGSQSATSFDRSRDLWAAGVLGIFPMSTDDDVRNLCATLHGTPASFATDSGRSWMLAGSLNVQYNHVATPNSAASDCGAGRIGSSQIEGCEYCSLAARSRHSGGVHALMMDGSVRFVGDGVNLQVWRAAASRSGAESASIE